MMRWSGVKRPSRFLSALCSTTDTGSHLSARILRPTDPLVTFPRVTSILASGSLGENQVSPSALPVVALLSDQYPMAALSLNSPLSPRALSGPRDAPSQRIGLRISLPNALLQQSIRYQRPPLSSLCPHSQSAQSRVFATSEAPPEAKAAWEADSGHSTNFSVWPRGGGMVHQEATVHQSATVDVGAVVWNGAEIGELCIIGSGAVVGPDVKVGSGTRLHYNVSLQNCRLGSSCIIHQGVSIGAEGFGFYVDDEGNMVKKPQTLGVVIGDEVEIGANSCVDRGSWRDTSIGNRTKIDNLVQVGHNVVVGQCCIICGQNGLGGSSTIGDYVVLAGQVGVADHVKVASYVRVGAKSGVTSNITKPGDYAGYPAVPAPEWRRQVVLQRKSGRTPHREAEAEDHAA